MTADLVGGRDRGVQRRRAARRGDARFERLHAIFGGCQQAGPLRAASITLIGAGVEVVEFFPGLREFSAHSAGGFGFLPIFNNVIRAAHEVEKGPAASAFRRRERAGGVAARHGQREIVFVDAEALSKETRAEPVGLQGASDAVAVIHRRAEIGDGLARPPLRFAQTAAQMKGLGGERRQGQRIRRALRFVDRGAAGPEVARGQFDPREFQPRPGQRDRAIGQGRGGLGGPGAGFINPPAQKKTLRLQEARPGERVNMIERLKQVDGLIGQRQGRIVLMPVLEKELRQSDPPPRRIGALIVLVEDADRRGVVLLRFRVQADRGLHVRLLDQKPGQVRRRRVGLHQAPRVLEVAQGCVEASLPRGQVGEVALGHGGGPVLVVLAKDGERIFKRRPRIIEPVEVEEDLAAIALQLGEDQRLIAERFTGAVEMLDGALRAVRHAVDHAEVEVGPRRERRLAVRYQRARGSGARFNRVIVPACHGEGVHRRQAQSGRLNRLARLLGEEDARCARFEDLLESPRIGRGLREQSSRPHARARRPGPVRRFDQNATGLFSPPDLGGQQALRGAGERFEERLAVAPGAQQLGARLRRRINQPLEQRGMIGCFGHSISRPGTTTSESSRRRHKSNTPGAAVSENTPSSNTSPSTTTSVSPCRASPTWTDRQALTA